MKKIIYDDKIFFESYKELREKSNSYNKLLEQPHMESLILNLKNKKILDLGCGFGSNSIGFIEKGASFVLGIDNSEKMLEVAVNINNDKNIEYLNLDLDELEELKRRNLKFDIVYSSLVFHYIKDFEKLIENINELLKKDGFLIFSQEHPLTLAPIEGIKWLHDEDNKIYYKLSDYGISGERKVNWFIDNISKYHRTFSEIINTLIERGFIIEKLLEPLPEEEAMTLNEKLKKERIKPSFICIRARKVEDI